MADPFATINRSVEGNILIDVMFAITPDINSPHARVLPGAQEWLSYRERDVLDRPISPRKYGTSLYCPAD